MRQIRNTVGQLEENVSIGDIHGQMEDTFKNGLKEMLF
jgi:hypothetical protein